MTTQIQIDPIHDHTALWSYTDLTGKDGEVQDVLRAIAEYLDENDDVVLDHIIINCDESGMEGDVLHAFYYRMRS